MKLVEAGTQIKSVESLPARGAWVEIDNRSNKDRVMVSRSPHGERGLKFVQLLHFFNHLLSLPARGAWVEIVRSRLSLSVGRVAPRTGSVG